MTYSGGGTYGKPVIHPGSAALRYLMSLLIQFVIPILLGNLFQQVYTLADRIIVGQFVGDKAFAAVGATNALSMLFLSIERFKQAIPNRRWNTRLIQQSLKVGIPTGLQYALIYLSSIILQRAVM